ncbi:MAG TPA: hypothetical protein VF177_11400, partial [Anaerolineae bacterium]
MPESQTDTAVPARAAADGNGEARESHLQQSAHQLAISHRLAETPTPDRSDLLDRLPLLATLLRNAYHYFVNAPDEELALSYAAEWLLDNFYVIQQAIRLIQEDLPKRYYHELPKLNSDSSLHGYPRIYDIAGQIIMYEACQLDLDRVKRYIQAYQDVTPLTMGELWALPLMLRLAILESLAQAVARITRLPTSTTVSDPALHFEYAISDSEIVANCIPGLHTLNRQEWKSYFEEISLVEQRLRRDPAAIYVHMDFDTRDRYRKVVEKMALGSGQSELAVAEKAIELAQSALAANGLVQGGVLREAHLKDWSNLHFPRTTHVGYYLLDRGQAQLEEQLGYRPTGLEQVRRWLFDHPTLLYLGSISFITVLLIWLFVWYAASMGSPLWQLVAVALLVLIPANSAAVGLVNWLITQTVSPRTLPKLNFEEGLPEACRTAIVVPAMLTSLAEVTSLLKQLEIHYLRNPDPNLS